MNSSPFRAQILTALALLALSTLASAAEPFWVGTWAASPAAVVVDQMNPATPPLAATGVTRQTVRQVVPATIGGSSVRLRISNAQGDRTLRVQDVFVGLASANASLEKGTHRPVTFGGASSILIPAGAYVLSDAVAMTLPQAKDVSISFFVPGPSGRLTTGQSGGTAFVAEGNVSSAETGDGFRKVPANALGLSILLAGVDVTPAASVKGSVAVLGDSLTAGGRTSWPGALWSRMAADGKAPTMSVLNFGLGGTRLLRSSPCFGESTLARYEDVLSHSHVKAILVAIGGNDIRIAEHAGGPTPGAVTYSKVIAPCWIDRTAVTADDLVAGLQQLVRRAHERGIRIYWTPITPYTSNAAERAVLTGVNEQVRRVGGFDAIFDTATPCTDPTDPWKLTKACDVGDNMHFSVGGAQIFAKAIDLGVLGKAVAAR